MGVIVIYESDFLLSNKILCLHSLINLREAVKNVQKLKAHEK